jgi:hypothetical protein
MAGERLRDRWSGRRHHVLKLGRIVLVLAALAFTSSASAQVVKGQFRLGLDTELVSYKNLLAELDDERQTVTEVGFGPGALEQDGPLPTPVGLHLGYVVHPHVIPHLSLSFGFSKLDAKYEDDASDFEESEEGPRIGTFVLSPRVEVPFNPDSAVVLGGVAGFDVRRFRMAEEFDGDDFSATVLGYGGVIGLSGHFFLGMPASLDVSALLHFHKLSQENDGPGEDDEIDFDTFRQLTFGILIGLSAWPGA